MQMARPLPSSDDYTTGGSRPSSIVKGVSIDLFSDISKTLNMISEIVADLK